VGAIAPTGKLVRSDERDCKENMKRPFECRRLSDGSDCFWFHESGAGRFSDYYVKSLPMKELLLAIEKVKRLRNDVAHNEPTPKLMNQATSDMQAVALWSNTNTFLSQPLVQKMLVELGEEHPERLLANLLADVRRLVSC
jgi:hypothetical protein